MDALALLCNLHADGPATARLLRRAGLRSPADIEACAPERLAEILGVSPAFARRFAREAHLLGVRMGSAPLEVEEPTETSANEPAEVNDLFSRTAARHMDSGARARSSERTFPVANPPRGSVTSAMRFPAARTPEIRYTTVAAEPTPARVVPLAGTPLRPHIFEGLDGTWCDRLIAQGVLTLETLADSPGLKLSKRLELPYTRLLDLQCLAKRAIAAKDVRPATAGETRPATAPATAPITASEPIVPTEGAREPIFILQPMRRAANESGLATPSQLGASEPSRMSAPLHKFGPRIDSEVAGPFA